jgi:N6-adenosine-specific RNA methylase IME4
MTEGGGKFTRFEDVPRRRYKVVMADPAWRFKTRTGEAKIPYPTMTLDEIKALPVAEVCDKDAHLFLWVTMPFLDKGFEVLRAWGFKYSTVAFVWVKLRKKAAGSLFYDTVHDFHVGQGYTTRANAEICLLGRRGKPVRLSKAVRQLIVSPLREHSRKPDEARARIESYAAGPRLEMNARQAAPGWDAWGDEIDLFPSTPT